MALYLLVGAGGGNDSLLVSVGSDDYGASQLAVTVQQKDWDGRISQDNKAWAKTVPVFENPDAWGTDRNCYLVVNSHPGLTDLFLSQARKAHTQEQQKSSVRDKLKKQPETTSPKLSAKSKGQER